VGVPNGIAALEDNFRFLKKWTFAIVSSNETSLYLLKNQNLTYIEHLHMMFIDLFITSKTWRQTRCSSVGMEYYSVLK
jgi:hypothetical protein